MNKPMTSLFSPFQQVFDNFWNMPITSWQRFFNPQLVFNYNPEDEGVEYHVLQRVGSYGRQLSTVIDMLCLLRDSALDESKLTPAQRLVLAEFERLAAESKRAVAEYRGEQTGVDGDQALALLRQLKQKDPSGFAALKSKLATLDD